MRQGDTHHHVDRRGDVLEHVTAQQRHEKHAGAVEVHHRRRRRAARRNRAGCGRGRDHHPDFRVAPRRRRQEAIRVEWVVPPRCNTLRQSHTHSRSPHSARHHANCSTHRQRFPLRRRQLPQLRHKVIASYCIARSCPVLAFHTTSSATSSGRFLSPFVMSAIFPTFTPTFLRPVCAHVSDTCERAGALCVRKYVRMSRGAEEKGGDGRGT